MLVTAIKLCKYFDLKYSTSQMFFSNKIFMFFLKKSLLLTKPAFIWSKMQQKQYNFEIFLLYYLK